MEKEEYIDYGKWQIKAQNAFISFLESKGIQKYGLIYFITIVEFCRRNYLEIDILLPYQTIKVNV